MGRQHATDEDRVVTGGMRRLEPTVQPAARIVQAGRTCLGPAQRQTLEAVVELGSSPGEAVRPLGLVLGQGDRQRTRLELQSLCHSSYAGF